MYQIKVNMIKFKRIFMLLAFAIVFFLFFGVSSIISSGLKIQEFMRFETYEPGVPGKSSPTEEFERLWNYIYKRQYECKKSEYIGGREFDGDGAYSICTEEKFWPTERKTKCLMYSFGVGGDFSFDDIIAERDCEVHSFDPSMEYKDGWVRDSGVTFHKIGIAGKDEDKDENGWKMRTFETLLHELGHSNKERYMDYLKIDTDKPYGGGFEDTLMQELLDTGLHKCVRQFAMEIHLPGPISSPKWLARCRRIYRQLTQLNDFGFRIFNTTDNVRAARVLQHNPNFSQLYNVKPNMVYGFTTVLWEIAMVNINAESCP